MGQAQSPLTQCWRYRAARDTIVMYSGVFCELCSTALWQAKVTLIHN